MDILLFIGILILGMSSIFIIDKLYEKKGLYLLLTIFLILSFVFSFKIVTILNFNLNLNIIPHTLIFSIIYLLLNKYYKKDEHKIIKLSIIIYSFMLIFTLLYCLYLPIVSDNMSMNINNLFINNYRISIIYPILLIIEEYYWIKIYNNLQPKYESIFVTSITNCILLGFIFTVIFCVFSYFMILDMSMIINIALTVYLFKIFITLINIPLLYFSTKKVKK